MSTQEFKVGDAVDIHDSGHWEGAWGVVSSVNTEGSLYTIELKAVDRRNILYTVGDRAGFTHGLTGHNEKPKATLVTKDTKPGIGDTIVSFWELDGIEHRAKGVVDRIDADGNYENAEGHCIDWDSDRTPETAPHTYIVERAPVKAPEPVVLPYQKFVDAAVGSIAYCAEHDFKWIKTADNEWSLFGADNVKVLGSDRTDQSVWQEEGYSTLTTFTR